jgi:hypothetical protein
MDERGKPPLTTPTAAWLAEQEAKQAAYAARRRAWAHAVVGQDGASAEEPPESPAPTSASSAPASEPPAASRRPRGVVHDPRQGRFEF